MDRDRPSFPPPLDQATLYQADRWQQPPGPNTDLARRGSQYLGVLRDLAVQPSWISLAHIADPPGETVTWIGQHIHQVNQRLQAILTDGLDCFEVAQRPRVQILAAPIAPQAGVDGFCNDGFWPGPDLCTAPMTLMVDPVALCPPIGRGWWPTSWPTGWRDRRATGSNFAARSPTCAWPKTCRCRPLTWMPKP